MQSADMRRSFRCTPFFHPLPLRGSQLMRKEGQWCILAPLLLTAEGFELRSRRVPRVSQPRMSTPKQILVEALPLIERIIRATCRGTMDVPRTEEFAGFVHLRLVEHNYKIIRAFRGQSSFGTYLTIVIKRLLKDYRDHEWGKWHASAEARRLGPLAIDLERLIVRDGCSIDEAFMALLPKYPGATRAKLEQLATRFPVRYRRKMTSLDERPEECELTDRLDSVSNAQTASLISKIVRDFIGRLPEQDQLLFQCRFEGEMPVPQIAKMLKQDAQFLYRRLRTHCEALRADLECAGIDAADVENLIGSDDAVLNFRPKTSERGPSNGGNSGAAPEEGP
jgi:RNA polymerase sigma factor (sigma-70 family)